MRLAVSELYKNGGLGLRPRGFTKLTLVPRDDDFLIYVNERYLTTIHYEGLRGGAIGMVASGQGEFALKNLTLSNRSAIRDWVSWAVCHRGHPAYTLESIGTA